MTSSVVFTARSTVGGIGGVAGSVEASWDEFRDRCSGRREAGAEPLHLLRCGAETMTRVGLVTIEGSCGVCGSYELVAVRAREHSLATELDPV